MQWYNERPEQIKLRQRPRTGQKQGRGPLWWGRPSSANHYASGNFFYTLRALFHLRFKRSTTILDPRQQTSLALHVFAVCQPPWEFQPFSVELRTDPEKDVPKPLQASDSGTSLGRGFWLWVRAVNACQKLIYTSHLRLFASPLSARNPLFCLPEQGISSELWDSLEIRFPTFRVRMAGCFSSPGPFPDLTEKHRLSSRYSHEFHALWFRNSCWLLCITSAHFNSCGTFFRTSDTFQCCLKANRSSCTSLSRRSLGLYPIIPRASLVCLSTREHWGS